MNKYNNSSIGKVPILLVDDDNFYRRLMITSLTGVGMSQIGEAESALLAIDYLKHKKPKLLILDVQMPEMNGLQLLQKIRAGETNAARDIPVIMLTSFTETEVLQKSLQLDVNGYIIKPTTANVMLEKLKSALNVSVKLKPESEYLAINTAVLDEAAQAKTVKKAPPIVKKVPDCTLIDIDDLEDGMVIGKDLLATDGTLLLKSQTVLSENRIGRLHELRRVLKEREVWIVDS